MIPITGALAKNFTPGDVTPDIWLDPADIGSLWQDAAGTIPVAASGDPVRLIKDKSGNGNHFTAPSDAARPTYRRGAGIAWLEFDGVANWMATSGNVSGFVTASTYDIMVAAKVTAGAQKPLLVFEGGYGTIFNTDAVADLVHGINYDGAFKTATVSAWPALRKIVHQSLSGGNLTLTVDNFTPNVVASGNTASIAVHGNLVTNDSGVATFSAAQLYGLIGRKTLFSGGEVAQVKTFLTNRFLSAGPTASFVFGIGESNVGGKGNNASLTTAEAAPRPDCQILNNTTLLFENLHIGFNNLIGHGGLPDNATHGIENGLANTQDSNRWPGQLYLLKAGQGGSVLLDWALKGNVDWITFCTRMAAARTQLDLLGVRPTMYAFISIGINDAQGFTAPATVAAGWIGMAANIREALGDSTIKVCFTKLPSGDAERDLYNAQWPTVLAASPYNLLIDTTGLTLNADGIHWDYAAFKTMANTFATLLGF